MDGSYQTSIVSNHTLKVSLFQQSSRLILLSSDLPLKVSNRTNNYVVYDKFPNSNRNGTEWLWRTDGDLYDSGMSAFCQSDSLDSEDGHACTNQKSKVSGVSYKGKCYTLQIG